MTLWLLRPVDGLPRRDNPWEPWFDKAFAFVVRAETEEAARELAHANAGDENLGEFMNAKIASTQAPWKDPRYSTCVELLPDGSAEVVIRDFASA